MSFSTYCIIGMDLYYRPEINNINYVKVIYSLILSDILLLELH